MQSSTRSLSLQNIVLVEGRQIVEALLESLFHRLSRYASADGIRLERQRRPSLRTLGQALRQLHPSSHHLTQYTAFTTQRRCPNL